MAGNGTLDEVIGISFSTGFPADLRPFGPNEVDCERTSSCLRDAPMQRTELSVSGRQASEAASVTGNQICNSGDPVRQFGIG